MFQFAGAKRNSRWVLSADCSCIAFWAEFNKLCKRSLQVTKAIVRRWNRARNQQGNRLTENGYKLNGEQLEKSTKINFHLE